MKYSKKWKPFNEAGVETFKDFDTRFSFDRVYIYKNLLNKNTKIY